MIYKGETTYKGYTIRAGDDYAIYFRPSDIEHMQIAGNVEQAKKFIDAHIVRGKDSRSGVGANTLKMAASAMKQAQKEGKTLAEATEIYKATLAQLLSRSTKDGFQVTSIGMHKVAEAKRRDFKLMASNSADEAENLRREGNLERAKKFLRQEAKWLTMASRDDETIYKEYKAQAHDSVPYDFVPKAQKALNWQISDLDEKIRGIEMKYGRSNSKLPGLRKKLKRLLSGKSVANDALSFTTLFWAGIIAALIAKHYGGQKETVGMGSYDLRNYQPAKKAWDEGNAHVGMLGVNADKAKALQRQLEKKGFEYRFPMSPPTKEMVRHAFVKKTPQYVSGVRLEEPTSEWRALNERANGYHNITTI